MNGFTGPYIFITTCFAIIGIISLIIIHKIRNGKIGYSLIDKIKNFSLKNLFKKF